MIQKEQAESLGLIPVNDQGRKSHKKKPRGIVRLGKKENGLKGVSKRGAHNGRKPGVSTPEGRSRPYQVANGTAGTTRAKVYRESERVQKSGNARWRKPGKCRSSSHRERGGIRRKWREVFEGKKGIWSGGGGWTS